MTCRFRHRITSTTALITLSLLGLFPVAQAAPALAHDKETALTLPSVAVEGEAPRPVEAATVIDQKAIDREVPQNLRDLFQGEPSITIPGSSTAAQKIYLHGIDQSKLNVTIDGAAQRAGIWHHNGNLTLDPTFLKSVEVDPGVSPADAGPGALGGTVAFKTKNATDMLLPGQEVGGTAILGYDTNSETWRTTGAGYAAKHGFELLGIGTLSRGRNYENGNGVTEAGTGTDLVSGLGKLAYESDGGHRLSVSGEHVRDDAVRRLRSNLGLVGGPTGPLMNSNTATRTTAVVSYETTQPTDWFNPGVTFSYTRNRLERPNENRRTTAHGAFDSQVDTIGLTVKNSFAIPTGTLTAGFDLSRDDIHIDRFHFTTDADERITNVGGFVQARLAPLERLRLSTGVRLDHQSYRSVDKKTFDNTGLSPNLSADYGLTDSLTAFGGYSYNWGGLEMAEAALFHAANYRYSSDLEPVTAHNMRAGLRYAHQGLRLEAAAFLTYMENPVAWNYTTYTRVNGEDLRTRGFDLTVGHDWSNAGINAKYTHTAVTYGNRMALSSDYNTAVPVGDLFALRGHYSFEDLRLTLGASSEIALKIEDDALRANGFRSIDGYQVVNLFTEWKPMETAPNWTLRAEANNIFDAAYVSRSSYGQTSTVQPALAEGRSVYLTSTVKF